jgi:hypothetical protein
MRRSLPRDAGWPRRRHRSSVPTRGLPAGTFEAMTTHRKRKTIDLFIDALVHPVRFR